MAKKKIRLGLIGCGGNMRKAHMPRVISDGAIDLVSVADPDEAQIREIKKIWTTPFNGYADFRRMLAKERLDAVMISSPHRMHYEHARAGLGKGLHVLVEKPLTISSRHSKSLIALAKKKRRFIQVGYQRNYYAPHVYARELVQKGAIGDLRGVVSYVTQNWGDVGGWRLNPFISGGGMFMDTGSHLVASTLWVTGLEPVEVFAFMDNSGKDVDINAVVNVRFSGGAMGTLDSFGNASRHDERLAIHGSRGCIVFRLHKFRLNEVLLNDQPMKIPSRIKETTPDAAFFKWIRNGGKGYTHPQYAVQVARLSEAAYESFLRKRPVKVAL